MANKIKKNDDDEKITEIEKVEEKKMYIYIGPRIKQGLFAKGKITDLSYKDKLKTELETCPILDKLFIDVDKYHELLPQIESNNSKYQNFIKEVLSNGI